MNFLSKLTTLGYLFIGLPLFSQLDSITIDATFEYSTAIDELGDTLQSKSIRVDTWVNDFDFFGEITLTVYELSSDVPFVISRFSKDEVVSQNLYADNVISVPIQFVEEGKSYRITSLVRNDEGLNIPMAETIVPL